VKCDSKRSQSDWQDEYANRKRARIEEELKKREKQARNENMSKNLKPSVLVRRPFFNLTFKGRTFFEMSFLFLKDADLSFLPSSTTEYYALSSTFHEFWY
jgi:hypothetical protein